MELDEETIGKAKEFSCTLGMSLDDFAVAAINWHLNLRHTL